MNVATILSEKGSDIISANPDDSLLDIAKTLRKHRIGCVVLTDNKGGIAGIVSERDIVRAIADAGSDVLSAPVSRCMTKKVVTCSRSETIDAIMAAMTDGRFRHMPVVEDEVLIGVISIGDVVRLRIAEAELEAAAMRDYIATG
ncbi:MAG: CBS domain-containing protein [Hyphomicrobiaceae bacterium]|nr:CBS domain-containing protein [Hyphomicrobiaceae bacterium]